MLKARGRSFVFLRSGRGTAGREKVTVREDEGASARQAEADSATARSQNQRAAQLRRNCKTGDNFTT